MPNHEFGIIDEISDSEQLYEQYQPELYHCISVDDDFIEPLLGKLNSVDTCFHCVSRREKGLAYCGITLIPPQSLPIFRSVFVQEQNAVYDSLISKIEQAMKQGKYMIHYGL